MRRVLMIPLALSLATVAPTGAQTSEVSLEAGGSRLLPPSDVDGDAAGFFVGGLRATRYGIDGTGGYGSLLFGRSLDAATGGDFLSAEAGGSAWRFLSASWSLGLEGRAFGFRVSEPFSYQAGAAEASTTLRFRRGPVTARVAATGGVGRSSVTLTTVVQRMRRQTQVEEVLEDNLWRWGGTAEFLVGNRALAAGLAGGAHRSAGGSYTSGGVRVISSGSLGAVELRADVWHTPDGNQTTGGIAFYVPWGAWSLRGVASRPEPDPLLLAEPGRGAGGVLVGRSLWRNTAGADLTTLTRVLDRPSGDGARVRFSVKAPSAAADVAVLGDFTLWEPVEMTSDHGRWTVELAVPAGTWHFGFLVDGTWYLPDDAPDAVPDEWGRKSATLVIESEEGAPDAADPDPRGAGER